jgi:hypothetical protein
VGDLTAIVLVCSKAIEGVVGVLAGQRHITGSGHRDFIFDDPDHA